MPVIYKITSPSEKVYVGQTWNWSKRKSTYKSLYCKGQAFLYHSFIKYGFENHEVEIIEYLPLITSQEELDNREIYWWKYYKDIGVEMLNIKEPGRGGKHSKITLEKLSKAALGRIPWNKGMKYSEEMSKKMISHLKRNPPGWKMPEEAKRKIGLANKGRIYPRKPHSEETRKKIGDAHKGKKMSSEHRLKLITINTGVKRSDDYKNKLKSHHKRPIVMLDLEGKFIKEFTYISDARNYIGVSQNTYINSQLSGKNKTCMGYQFVLKQNYGPNKDYRIGRGGTRCVDQYTLDNVYIKTFMSFMDAERELGIKYANTGIHACCKNKFKQAYGFIWKYKN